MGLVGDCLEEINDLMRKNRDSPEGFEVSYWRFTKNMLEQFVNLSPKEKNDLQSIITRDESGLLFGLARGNAEVAVQKRSRSHFRWGLLALIIENQNHDYRKTLIELTLLDNSARKLDCKLETIFDQVKEFASNETKELFETYFREGYRNINAIEYIEDLDKHGEFTYKQNW